MSMLKSTLLSILLGAGAIFMTDAAQAASPTDKAATGEVIVTRGDLPTAGALRLGDLQALGATTATWTHHGQTHQGVGVPLIKVLARFGFVPGVMGKNVPPPDKRSGYRLAVVASAPDGFQAVFSVAELAEGMGKTQALLMWTIDGKPIAADAGPVRLVVPTDDEPSRSVFSVHWLDVIDLRKIVPPLQKQSGAASTKPAP